MKESKHNKNFPDKIVSNKLMAEGYKTLEKELRKITSIASKIEQEVLPGWE